MSGVLPFSMRRKVKPLWVYCQTCGKRIGGKEITVRYSEAPLPYSYFLHQPLIKKEYFCDNKCMFLSKFKHAK